MLNTRPILNVLRIDRVDLLTLIAGREVYVGPTVRREVREHVVWSVRDLEIRARRRPEDVDPGEIGYVENLRRWDVRLTSHHIRWISGLEYEELEYAERLMRAGRLDPGESEVLAIAGIAAGWLC